MPVEDGEWDDPILVPPKEPTDNTVDEGLDHVDSPIDPGDDDHSIPPTESQPTTQAEEDTPSAEASEVEESEVSEVPEFDPQYKQEFEGLLYIGKLEDQFDWLGHRFVIRTLDTEELLEIGLLHKEYVGGLSDVKAYQALLAAASVVSVDGKSLPMPLSDGDSALRNRFNHVVKWFPPTIDVIYEKILNLESQVDDVIEAMGKAHG